MGSSLGTGEEKKPRPGRVNNIKVKQTTRSEGSVLGTPKGEQASPGSGGKRAGGGMWKTFSGHRNTEIKNRGRNYEQQVKFLRDMNSGCCRERGSGKQERRGVGVLTWGTGA